MTKKKLGGIFCVVFSLGVWSWFCVVKIPSYQAEQYTAESSNMVIQIHELNQKEYYMIDIPVTEVQVDLIQVDVPEVSEAESTPLVEEVPATYTEAELQLMARLIQSEGGTESYQCKLCIGSVVLNRMARWEATMYDIVFDSKPTVQFSVTIRKNGRAPIDCEPSEESLAAAKELLTNGTLLPPDVMVFYSESCDDGWVTSRKTYTKVDHTVFAYSNN